MCGMLGCLHGDGGDMFCVLQGYRWQHPKGGSTQNPVELGESAVVVNCGPVMLPASPSLWLCDFDIARQVIQVMDSYHAQSATTSRTTTVTCRNMQHKCLCMVAMQAATMHSCLHLTGRYLQHLCVHACGGAGLQLVSCVLQGPSPEAGVMCRSMLSPELCSCVSAVSCSRCWGCTMCHMCQQISHRPANVGGGLS